MSNEDQAPTSCCSTSPAADSGHRENLLVEGSDGMTTCPVMVGNPVNKQDAEEKGLFRDYDGQRYWLCCPGSTGS